MKPSAWRYGIVFSCNKMKCLYIFINFLWKMRRCSRPCDVKAGAACVAYGMLLQHGRCLQTAFPDGQSGSVCAASQGALPARGVLGPCTGVRKKIECKKKKNQGNIKFLKAKVLTKLLPWQQTQQHAAASSLAGLGWFCPGGLRGPCRVCDEPG